MTTNNSRFGESKGNTKDKRIIRVLVVVVLIGGFQAATQYFAQQFNYQPQLGAHFNHLYESWAVLVWADQWYGQYPDIFDRYCQVNCI